MINNNKLKLSLQEIKNAIDINKTTWINSGDTNCYAYALGLDIVEEDILDYAYIPGVMSKCNVNLYDKHLEEQSFQYNDFLNNLYSDFNFLGINFREVTPNEIILPDEWKIAIFTTPCKNGCSDFHFLRLCKDGIWHHKNGYCYSPTIYDDNKQIITNVEDCYLEYRQYQKCLSLKLK